MKKNKFIDLTKVLVEKTKEVIGKTFNNIDDYYSLIGHDLESISESVSVTYDIAIVEEALDDENIEAVMEDIKNIYEYLVWDSYATAEDIDAVFETEKQRIEFGEHISKFVN